MKVTVSRKAHFNAAHRLYRKDWSNEKNDEVFGKCNNPNFHGHNYELIVSVTGDIDQETGYVIDMKVLKNLGGTVGSLVYKDFDNDGYLDFLVPNYDKNYIEVYTFAP